MSDISEAAKLKACEWANAQSMLGPVVLPDCVGREASPIITGFARYVQQASDTLKGIVDDYGVSSPQYKTLAPFILPDPPADPLVEALKPLVCDADIFAGELRYNLAKRGLQIVPAQP